MPDQDTAASPPCHGDRTTDKTNDAPSPTGRPPSPGRPTIPPRAQGRFAAPSEQPDHPPAEERRANEWPHQHPDGSGENEAGDEANRCPKHCALRAAGSVDADDIRQCAEANRGSTDERIHHDVADADPPLKPVPSAYTYTPASTRGNPGSSGNTEPMMPSTTSSSAAANQPNSTRYGAQETDHRAR